MDFEARRPAAMRICNSLQSRTQHSGFFEYSSETIPFRAQCKFTLVANKCWQDDVNVPRLRNVCRANAGLSRRGAV
jgi:hypothetical protein